MKPQLALLSILVGSCTFGGSDEDPSRLLPGVRADAGLDASAPDQDGESGSPAVTTPDARAVTRGDASPVPSDASTTDDPESRDGSQVSADAGDVVRGCAPSTPVVGCDPVRNTGCAPLTQCDVEPGAATPTGRCVFPQAAPVDGCMVSVVSETCAPASTCVTNACRKLCYCDEDCGAGACCTDSASLDATGFFRLCQPC